MRVYHDFFWYPDPDQRFLKWIRIRTNDTDPTGSGYETLVLDTIIDFLYFFSVWSCCGGCAPAWWRTRAARTTTSWWSWCAAGEARGVLEPRPRAPQPQPTTRVVLIFSFHAWKYRNSFWRKDNLGKKSLYCSTYFVGIFKIHISTILSKRKIK